MIIKSPMAIIVKSAPNNSNAKFPVMVEIMAGSNPRISDGIAAPIIY